MAVGPPVIRTVFTSNPSAAKKPNSWATTSGSVPLKVGVLEAKLTDLAKANSGRPPNGTSNVSSSRANLNPVAHEGFEEFLLPPRRGKIEMGVLSEAIMNHPHPGSGPGQALYPPPSRGGSEITEK